MPEFDLQATRMLWAPPIRPNQGLVEQILNRRFTDWIDGWRFGLLQQEAGVSTSTQTPILDLNSLPGTEEFGCVVTHILGYKTGSTGSTATISFGTNASTYDNWHTGIDISGINQGDWYIVYPYPDSDGYGSDTPAPAVKKVLSSDFNHDQFFVRNTGGTWGSSHDFYMFGYYWRESE